MLEFCVWRELASAYVVVEAQRFGWSLHRVTRASSTRSVYLRFVRGSDVVCVRLSDHRGRSGVRCLSVRQRGSAMLAWLRAFFELGRKRSSCAAGVRVSVATAKR